MVQIKTKEGHVVETPPPRRFWCGLELTFENVRDMSKSSAQDILHKRALSVGALLREMTCILRHPMGLHHPVLNVLYTTNLDLTFENVGDISKSCALTEHVTN